MLRFISVLFMCSIFAFGANVKPGDKLAKEQVFVFNAKAAPASLDPQKVEGVPEGLFARNLFETLVISDENDKIIPGAAEKWEHSEDFKTWTFYLRKDAKWSNGDLVTAHDFVFGWQRLVDPKTASPYASYLSYMKLKNADKVVKGELKPDQLGIKAKDDYTLVLELEESVPFADLLTEFYVLSPAPKKVVEELKDAWSEPKNIVGNGAFKLESMIINEKGTLKRNPYYWDNKNTVLDTLIFLQIPSPNTELSRYRAGDLDVSVFPPELVDKVKKEYPNDISDAVPIFCTYYYEFNINKAPFDDVRVRKALSMALDRNLITDKILRQGQKPAYAFTPPLMNQADKIGEPEWSKWDMEKRYEEAKKLLSEAGYNKDNPLSFELLYNTNENHKKIALAVSSLWKQKLGGIVNVKLVNQEWKTFLSTRRALNHQMSRAGWCSDYNEASSFLNIFLSDSSNNTTGFKNKEYDEMIQKAYISDDEKRSLHYVRAEEILEEQTPLMPVYFYSEQELIKPYVRGYKLKPSKSYYFKDVYIVEH